LLWGVTDAQINAMASAKKISTLTSFYSNAAGYITALPVLEGQFISEGSTILKLADLSHVWAEAQVYSSQLATVGINKTASVRVPDLPGKEWTGKIEFANPEIVTDSRLNLIRIAITNPQGLLKPGMPAYVSIRDKKLHALSLPSDAVLRDGKTNIVWVQSGKNNFKMKRVETGWETGETIEIRSGLQEGDQVVIHGAYLLHSEYVFKKGANGMGGMKM